MPRRLILAPATRAIYFFWLPPTPLCFIGVSHAILCPCASDCPKIFQQPPFSEPFFIELHPRDDEPSSVLSSARSV